MLHVRSAFLPSRGSETSQYWELIFTHYNNQGSLDASAEPPPLAQTGAWLSTTSKQAARSAVVHKKLVVLFAKEGGGGKQKVPRKINHKKKAGTEITGIYD